MMMRPLIRKNSRVKLDLELESRVFECIQKAPRQNLKNPKALNETVVHTVIVYCECCSLSSFCENRAINGMLSMCVLK